MAARQVHHLAGYRTVAVLQLCALVGCATMAHHEATDGLQPASGPRPDSPPSIHLSSFQALDPDLQDPLAASRGFGWSTTRLQVSAQTMCREMYDGLVGVVNSAHKRDWDDWAAAHLQDGDIVFLQGSGNFVLGFIDFSRLSRQVVDSDFTHVGVAAVEDGQVYIYDVDQPGPGRIPFGTMMASPHVKAVAIKRLRPHCGYAIAPALAYCRRVYQSKLPFDRKLKLGNDRLYCAEMVELAFRSGGQVLSRPVCWKDLPRVDEYPLSVGLIRTFTGIQMDDRVVLAGNDRLGLWSSPDLQLVLALTDSSSRPIW